MPLIANPDVRDPMSAPWSPVQSGPSTPVAGVACLPAVTKFKRDNQLLGVPHSSSGLFTPPDGSGSSSPSPSDTATPEDRPSMEVETEMPVAGDDGRHQEGQTTPMVAPPASGSPEVQGVESNAIPADLSEDGGWEEVPRLSMPPIETADHLEGTLTAVPTAREFFQPVESSDNVVEDVPRKGNQCQDVQGLGNPKPLVYPSDDTTKDDLEEVIETDDPFKFMGDSSAVTPGAVANNDDVSSISSSPPDEKTPR